MFRINQVWIDNVDYTSIHSIISTIATTTSTIQNYTWEVRGYTQGSDKVVLGNFEWKDDYRKLDDKFR